MDLELLIATSGFVLLIGIINLIDAIARYKKWLKNNEMIAYFPIWKGTKIPLIWYIIWVFIDFLSLPLFICLALYGNDVGALLACLLIVAGYIILIRIIYAIIFSIVKSSLNKK